MLHMHMRPLKFAHVCSNSNLEFCSLEIVHVCSSWVAHVRDFQQCAPSSASILTSMLIEFGKVQNMKVVALYLNFPAHLESNQSELKQEICVQNAKQHSDLLHTRAHCPWNFSSYFHSFQSFFTSTLKQTKNNQIKVIINSNLSYNT
ncbi:hypothetical protein ACH5RR_009158 [Cinchona calisaya]|uniref:Uncharacterized protein n=1 Tax=Cinchona calisaya TaxID=153742 RepID=A0ABD3ADI3_9GENT